MNFLAHLSSPQRRLSSRAAVVLVGGWLVLFGSARGAVVAQEVDDEIRLLDTIRLKNGNEFQGVILSEDPYRVEFQRRTGLQATGGPIITYNRDDIAAIVPHNWPRDIYVRKARVTKAHDAGGQHELARWCHATCQDPKIPDDQRLWDEARKHFELATAIDPMLPTAYQALLELYARTPDSQKTMDQHNAEMGVYLRGLRAGISIPELAFRAARVLEALGEPEGASLMLERLLANASALELALREAVETEYVRLLEATGRRADAQEFMKVIGQRGGDTSVDLLLIKLNWLLESMAQGDATAAAAIDETAAAVLKLDPESGRAFLLRGTRHMLAGDYDRAAQDFTQAIQQGMVSAEPILTVVLNYALSGFGKKALEMLGSVSTHNVPEQQINQQLVRAYLLENSGDLKNAWDLIRQSATAELTTWQARIVYLQALDRFEPSASFDALVGAFLKDYAQNPVAFAECALLMGDRALRVGDGARARRWIDYAASVLPLDIELALRLGHAQLLEGGDLERARQVLEDALRRDNKNLDVRNALGCLEYRAGNLELARAQFDKVLAGFDKAALEAAEPQPALAYALASRAQIEATLTEELWRDDFERENAKKLLNNWVDAMSYGVELGIRGGAAAFQGTQKFEADALTMFHRTFDGELPVRRVRARFKLVSGMDRARVALRCEDAQGVEGLVFYRDLDGVMCFALNSRDKSESFRPAETAAVAVPAESTAASAERRDDPFKLQRVVWPLDGHPHRLEIRATGETGVAELYFDDERVASNVRVPIRARGQLRVGVSGQAELGVNYDFEVLDFEVFRRKAVGANTPRK
ncbi:MAG: tetratricopeptide repeat protein [Planctomycetota bacterium]